MPRNDPEEVIRAATVAIGHAAKLLSDAGVDGKTLHDNKGKVYEAWILLALGADLSKLLQCQPAWYTGSYRPVKRGEHIVFRGSPAKLKRDGRQTPGFLMLKTLDGTAFELHNSLQFTGASRVDHELDICLLQNQARETWVTGDANYLPHLVGLELKCHTSAISLPLVRQAALTRIDLSASHGGQGHAFIYHGFVTFSSLSKNGRTLAQHYHLGVFEGIGKELTNLAPAFTPVATLAEAILEWWKTAPADRAGETFNRR